jgi:hypothetical protein
MYLLIILFAIPLGFALLQHHELPLLERLSGYAWRALRRRIADYVAAKNAQYDYKVQSLRVDPQSPLQLAVAATDDAIRVLGYCLLTSFAAGCVAICGVSAMSPAPLVFGGIYLFSARRFLRAVGAASSKRTMLLKLLQIELKEQARTHKLLGE